MAAGTAYLLGLATAALIFVVHKWWGDLRHQSYMADIISRRETNG
jgi:hypothetical protein